MHARLLRFNGGHINRPVYINHPANLYVRRHDAGGLEHNLSVTQVAQYNTWIQHFITSIARPVPAHKASFIAIDENVFPQRGVACTLEVDEGTGVRSVSLNVYDTGGPGTHTKVVEVADTAGTPGLAFFGAAPIAKPTVAGAKGGNVALANLLTALANLGLITDSTT